MSKVKVKKIGRRKVVPRPLQSSGSGLPKAVNAAEMQHIIACAIAEAGEISRQREQAKREREQLEWLQSIGYRDYSEISHKLWRRLRSFGNWVHRCLAVLFIPKGKLVGNRASTAFLQTCLAVWFGLLQAACFILSLSFLTIILGPLVLNITALDLIGKIAAVFFASLFLLLFGIFRIMRLEVDKIKDQGYLFGLFSSITSLVSLIVAVIAIVKGA